MSFVTANGVRLHIQRLGEKGAPTVVFLHGLILDNLSSWYYTVANPIARHAEVLLYDLRGHGLSERPPEGYTVDDSVADLEALLDVLGIEHPVYLVGNSYGGLVALAFAQALPERVAGLGLVDAHFPVAGWSEQVSDTLMIAGVWVDEPRVKAWLEHNNKRHHRRRMGAAKEMLGKTTMVADLRAAQPFSNEALSKITCPTLALYGEHSDVIERGHELAQYIPNCELRILEEASHSILMERAGEVRDHLIGWLGKQAVPLRDI